MSKKDRLEYKLQAAQNFSKQGKMLHAVQLYHSIINENPRFPEAYILLSGLYEASGKFNSAWQLLNSFMLKNPEDNNFRLYVGNFLMRNLRWDESVEVLSYIMPEDEPEVSFMVGYSYFMLNDFELSKLNFEKFLSLGKKSELYYEANLYLAKVEIAIKNYKKARRNLKTAGVIFSNFWEWNLLNAIVYYYLDMDEHAVDSVERATKLNPSEPSVYEWSGKIYLKLGNYKKAEIRFLKSIDINPDISSEIYLELAEVYRRTHRTKDVKKYLNLALKLEPGNISIKEKIKNNSINIK